MKWIDDVSIQVHTYTYLVDNGASQCCLYVLASTWTMLDRSG